MMPGLLEAPALFMPSDSEFPRIVFGGNSSRCIKTEANTLEAYCLGVLV